MRVRSRRTKAAVRHLGGDHRSELALHYACNVYMATERRMPEAWALVTWLAQTASAFGLSEAAIPGDEAPYRTGTRRTISVGDWRKIGAALDEARTHRQPRRNGPIDPWLAKIAATLELDPLETEILALALQYRLDQRVSRLFDALSDCWGGATRYQKDAALIGLLLQASAGAVD
jgi:hypothetical protein